MTLDTVNYGYTIHQRWGALLTSYDNCIFQYDEIINLRLDEEWTDTWLKGTN